MPAKNNFVKSHGSEDYDTSSNNLGPNLKKARNSKLSKISKNSSASSRYEAHARSAKKTNFPHIGTSALVETDTSQKSGNRRSLAQYRSVNKLPSYEKIKVSKKAKKVDVPMESTIDAIVR